MRNLKQGIPVRMRETIDSLRECREQVTDNRLFTTGEQSRTTSEEQSRLKDVIAS